MSDDQVRFGGVGRLFGAEGLARLRRAHVCVVGLGGVGSWSVEALARSGVGTLTLVDLDDICLSNVNRQLHAIEGAIGQPKVEVMARRVQSIDPACVVHVVHAFLTPATAAEILAPRFDYVIDAIDKPAHKAFLIAQCRQRGIPVGSVGAAGGRRGAVPPQVADLSVATHDPLLAEVRARLRKEHGFPRDGQPFGVDAVFSTEPAVNPRLEHPACEGPRQSSSVSLRLDCESGYGTACFVTGTFGFAAAGHVVRQLAANK